uniref:Putative lipocalin-2 1 n=1 Tax=Amblyomma triste TaxID=251400 RepID=A0A023GB11_AMBTT
MNFYLALLVSVTASAAAWDHETDIGFIHEPIPPYPSPEPIAKDLDIMRVINVNERLVVMMRKHTIGTSYRCLSALKTGGSGKGPYEYKLKARKGIHTGDQYINVDIRVTLESLGGTTPGYKAIYYQEGNKVTLTLKKVDDDGKCFVLFADHGKNNGGCELLLKKSALRQDIPANCLSYYENQCGGVSIQLREEGCKYDDIPKLVPIEKGPEVML